MRTKVESIVTIGKRDYKSYEVYVNGERVYQDSILTRTRRTIVAAARRQDSFLESYVSDPSCVVTEKVVTL